MGRREGVTYNDCVVEVHLPNKLTKNFTYVIKRTIRFKIIIKVTLARWCSKDKLFEIFFIFLVQQSPAARYSPHYVNKWGI
jgi:hypothetical protein